MGKALQIRVSAVTWDTSLPEKLWPRLTELAYSLPVPPRQPHVPELVHALENGLDFMDWSEARQKAMGPGIRKAAALTRELEAALAAWQPREANALTDALEEVLNDLEAAYMA